MLNTPRRFRVSPFLAPREKMVWEHFCTLTYLQMPLVTNETSSHPRAQPRKRGSSASTLRFQAPGRARGTLRVERSALHPPETASPQIFGFGTKIVRMQNVCTYPFMVAGVSRNLALRTLRSGMPAQVLQQNRRCVSKPPGLPAGLCACRGACPHPNPRSL